MACCCGGVAVMACALALQAKARAVSERVKERSADATMPHAIAEPAGAPPADAVPSETASADVPAPAAAAGTAKSVARDARGGPCEFGGDA